MFANEIIVAPKKTLVTLFTVLRFVCCLMNVPTRTEYIIRTKHAIYESKFQRTIRSCLSLIPWTCDVTVQVCTKP